MDTETNTEAAPLDIRREPPHLIGEVMRASQALIAAFSREVGMPPARLAVLRLLAITHPDGLGTMEIARQLGVNAAAVTRLVQTLEAEGLIDRTPDPRDARRSALRLSNAGQAAFQTLHARVHAFEQALHAEFTAEEIAVATRVLTRLRTAIQDPH
ncbi:MAG TPA: MarR family transcriptional regulator [Armatimonadota bacterium]|jgi:DNA-binding MarR family transcriptional regulator